MTKKHAIDGFVPRRSPGVVGEAHNRGELKLPHPDTSVGLQRRIPVHHSAMPVHVPRSSSEGNGLAPTRSDKHGLTRADIDDSLKQIDNDDQQSSKKSRRSKRGGEKSRRRRIIKRIVLFLILVVLLIGGWIGVKALMASKSVFKGDIFGLIQQKELKKDANGRSNILIFGTSEDDEGGNHPGAALTDSIMVLSISQSKKDAFMVSLPRDLWVSYKEGCSAGYQFKLNELFNCTSAGGSNKDAGAKALMGKAKEVTGLDVQYHIHVNYTVVRQTVDAVGGITVKVESSDPRGILDRNFDWKCNYKCHYVKYANGEVAQMDGEHALAFMRARNAQGGYGLAGGNFDRERNQQKVIVALREKALSAGTLSNPAKVTGLIDALGNNMSTDFDTSEIRTLLSLASDIKSNAITSISLDKDGESVMTTANHNGVSIVRPSKGLFDYSDVTSYIKREINADAATREKAKIAVLNGSGVAGQAQIAADKLSDMGFIVSVVSNAPEGKYGRREVYQRDDKSMSATRTKLASMYGSEPKTGLSKFGVSADIDFVIVIGEADTKAK